MKPWAETSKQLNYRMVSKKGSVYIAALTYMNSGNPDKRWNYILRGGSRLRIIAMDENLATEEDCFEAMDERVREMEKGK